MPITQIQYLLLRLPFQPPFFHQPLITLPQWIVVATVGGRRAVEPITASVLPGVRYHQDGCEDDGYDGKSNRDAMTEEVPWRVGCRIDP